MTTSARERILAAADELFYAHGIGAVGIDLVVDVSGAAKQTLYNHFSSKDLLVAAYLDGRSERAIDAGRAALERLGDAGARARVGALFEGIGRASAGPYRGCPFINATAEYPDADHPVRVAVAAHRARFRALVAAALAHGSRHDVDDDLVGAVTELHDGAMVAAVHDATAARRAAAHALDLVVGR